MKITNCIVEGAPLLRLVSALYEGEYRILLKFTDSKEILMDFKSFLTNSLHEDISKYLDKTLFQKFEIVNGNLNWNDYDMIFPIEDLHSGNVEHNAKNQSNFSETLLSSIR